MRKLTTEQFIQKAKEIYPDQGYDYSQSNYVSSRDKITVICPIHGKFEKNANSFLKGSGCPKCGRERMRQAKSDTQEDFIRKAKQVHRDKYDYSKVNYCGQHQKVEIICPIHGSFFQTPGVHIYGHGCPKCKESHGERLISSYLDGGQINYLSQHELEGNFRSRKKIIVDFYIPSKQLVIEYNGRQHYMPIPFTGDQEKAERDFLKQKVRDEDLRKYCEEQKLNLVEIPYTYSSDQIITLLNSILK